MNTEHTYSTLACRICTCQRIVTSICSSPKRRVVATIGSYPRVWCHVIPVSSIIGCPVCRCALSSKGRMPDQLRIVVVQRRELVLGNKFVPFRHWRLVTDIARGFEMNRHNLLRSQ